MPQFHEKSAHKVLSYPANKQKDRQTNGGENSTPPETAAAFIRQ